ncbi:hypothetical protein ABBQ38_010338 [Trebouxia sp. C0009 RCD-2024]
MCHHILDAGTTGQDSQLPAFMSKQLSIPSPPVLTAVLIMTTVSCTSSSTARLSWDLSGITINRRRTYKTMCEVGSALCQQHQHHQNECLEAGGVSSALIRDALFTLSGPET